MCSRKNPWPLFAAISLGGLALLLFLILSAGTGDFFSDERIIAAGWVLFGVCEVVGALRFRLVDCDRIEVDGREMVCRRRGEVRRRCSLFHLESVAAPTGMGTPRVEFISWKIPLPNVWTVTVKFATGERVRIDSMWTHGCELVAYLERALDLIKDARAAPGADPLIVQGLASAASFAQTDSGALRGEGRVTLPLQYLTFPSRCVRCGEPQQQMRPLSASSGLWILGNSMVQKLAVSVPVCNACRVRRENTGLLVGFGFILLSVAAIVAIGFAINPFMQQRDSPLIVPVIVVFVGLLLLVPNLMMFWVPRLSDGIALGVRVASLGRGDGNVRLRFRNPDLAEDVIRETNLSRREWLALEKAQSADRASGEGA